MTCNDVVERGLAEDYLLGRLADEERDAFERHYFDCARCFAELQALREVQDVLRREVATASPRIGNWGWLAAAALVMLSVAAGALIWRGAGSAAPSPAVVSREPAAQPPVTPSAPRLDARLARVDPPPYEPRRLRSGSENRDFVAGMERYQAGDYTGAAARLEAAVAADSAFEPARFYLGASQIVAGNPRAAVVTLAPIASRVESPFAEEARFLTAKAHLQAGDVAAATRELDRTIELRGEREAEARRIKAALANLR